MRFLRKETSDVNANEAGVPLLKSRKQLLHRQTKSAKNLWASDVPNAAHLEIPNLFHAMFLEVSKIRHKVIYRTRGNRPLFDSTIPTLAIYSLSADKETRDRGMQTTRSRARVSAKELRLAYRKIGKEGANYIGRGKIRRKG